MNTMIWTEFSHGQNFFHPCCKLYALLLLFIRYLQNISLFFIGSTYKVKFTCNDKQSLQEL
jgi:hypothetical protein